MNELQSRLDAMERQVRRLRLGLGLLLVVLVASGESSFVDGGLTLTSPVGQSSVIIRAVDLADGPSGIWITNTQTGRTVAITNEKGSPVRAYQGPPPE
jgi:hypothetical protein